MDSLIGQQFGDYVLEQKLTTGGMSHIYIGIDHKLKRKAAIKILTPEFTKDDSTLKDRFEREARAIAQLEHDNIVPIYQFGEKEDVYFLAMRFIEGHDLADELNGLHKAGEKLNTKRALRILDQVADALDYAHSRGIIHRDIKPSNILIGKNDKAVLSDFGLVLQKSVDRTMGTAFGTPRYISPEQATDSQSAVPQSDIYSLAVMVYEIVTSQQVFKAATPMEMAIQHITETPIPPMDVSPDVPLNVSRAIMRALEKRPEDRYDTAKAFVDAVHRGFLETGKMREDEPETLSDITIPFRHREANRELSAAIEAKSGKPTSTLKFDDENTTNSNLEPAKSTGSIAKPVPSDAVLEIEPGGRSSRVGFIALLLMVILGGLAFLTFYTTRTPEGNRFLLAMGMITETASSTPMPTHTLTLSPTLSPEPSPTSTETAQPSETAKPSETEASDPLTLSNLEKTGTAAALEADTGTTEPTATEEATETETATRRPSSTPKVTKTSVPTETAIPTEAASATTRPSATPRPSKTPTDSPTAVTSDLFDIRPADEALKTNDILKLIYNVDILMIRNPGLNPIAISELAFIGEVPQDTFTNEGGRLGPTLEAGACIILKAQSVQSVRIPAEWQCVNGREIALTGENIFWRADSQEDQSFRILTERFVAMECDTVGRAVKRIDEQTCEFRWLTGNN